jgi:hypothetical protein
MYVFFQINTDENLLSLTASIMQCETINKALTPSSGTNLATCVSSAEMAREALVKMIRDSVIALCLGGLMDGSNIERVEGLIGITLKSHEVFLVNIGENIERKTAGMTPIKDGTTSLPAIDNTLDLNSEMRLNASDAVKDICSELFDSEEQAELTKSTMSRSSALDGQMAEIPELYCKDTFRQSNNGNDDDATAATLAHVMSITKQQRQSVTVERRHSLDNCRGNAFNNIDSNDPGSIFIKQEPLVSDGELSENDDLNDSADLDFMVGFLFVSSYWL